MSVLAQQPCFAPLEGPWERENCGSGAVHPNTKTRWKALQSLTVVFAGFSLYTFKCALSLCHLDRAFRVESVFLRGRLDFFFSCIPCMLSLFLKKSQALFHSVGLLGCGLRACKCSGTRGLESLTPGCFSGGPLRLQRADNSCRFTLSVFIS